MQGGYRRQEALGRIQMSTLDHWIESKKPRSEGTFDPTGYDAGHLRLLFGRLRSRWKGVQCKRNDATRGAMDGLSTTVLHAAFDIALPAAT